MVHKIKREKMLDLKTKYSIVTTLILVVVAIIAYNYFWVRKDTVAEIITESSIAKIINVSELSTFEATYNGVAKKYNKNNEIDYYVSYNAKVKAGIDFEKVDIEVNNEEKKIIVKIPDIKINEPNVDISTLDYIFLNDKANTSDVSAEAYKLCIEDATKETQKEEAIYEIAKENANNVIEALILPFVQQLDNEYTLYIE